MSERQRTGQTFPKRLRLRKRAEFLAVQKNSSRKVHTRHFLVLAAPRKTSGAHLEARVGITVSKKVGIAVTRNRIKRLVREFVRHHAEWLPPGQDVVIIAKHGAGTLAGYAEVEKDLLAAKGRLSR